MSVLVPFLRRKQAVVADDADLVVLDWFVGAGVEAGDEEEANGDVGAVRAVKQLPQPFEQGGVGSRVEDVHRPSLGDVFP